MKTRLITSDPKTIELVSGLLKLGSIDFEQALQLLERDAFLLHTPAPPYYQNPNDFTINPYPMGMHCISIEPSNIAIYNNNTPFHYTQN